MNLCKLQEKIWAQHSVIYEWEWSRCFQSYLRQKNAGGWKSRYCGHLNGSKPWFRGSGHFDSLSLPFSVVKLGKNKWDKQLERNTSVHTQPSPHAQVVLGTTQPKTHPWPQGWHVPWMTHSEAFSEILTAERKEEGQCLRRVSGTPTSPLLDATAGTSSVHQTPVPWGPTYRKSNVSPSPNESIYQNFVSWNSL